MGARTKLERGSREASMKARVGRVLAAFCIGVILLALSSCGGGGGGGGGGANLTIFVSANPTTLQAGQTAQLGSTVMHAGDCPTGNEGLLNGQYAFLLRGGGSPRLVAMIGSFSADGSGNITGGLEDLNDTASAPQTDLAVTSPASLYSVGVDKRGCLALVTSQVTILFRFALSSVSGGGREGADHRIRRCHRRWKTGRGLPCETGPVIVRNQSLSGQVRLRLVGSGRDE